MEGITIKIGDLDVTLPDKFSDKVGTPLTEEQAKIIFAHVAGQFRNNQNANAKARSDRYAKATNDVERDENAPLNIDGYLTIWNTYLPNVGEGPRQSSVDKLRTEAAKRAWAQLVSDHNAALDAGEKPILKTNKKQGVAQRPVKTKAVSTEQHETNVKAWEVNQAQIYERLLSSPQYADRIQAQLDLLNTEQGKKTAAADVETASQDVI